MLIFTGYIKERSGAVLDTEWKTLSLCISTWLCCKVQEISYGKEPKKAAFGSFQQEKNPQICSGFLQAVCFYFGASQGLMLQGMASHEEKFVCLCFQNSSGTQILDRLKWRNCFLSIIQQKCSKYLTIKLVHLKLYPLSVQSKNSLLPTIEY